MAHITVYTVGPSDFCQRITNLLDARGLSYSLVQLETEEERDALVEKSGRMTCPLVFVGDELIGGVQETIDADRSGRLARLAPGGCR